METETSKTIKSAEFFDPKTENCTLVDGIKCDHEKTCIDIEAVASLLATRIQLCRERVKALRGNIL